MSTVESAIPDTTDRPSAEHRRRGLLHALLVLSRPKHWTKNVIVILLPWVFVSRWTVSAAVSIGTAVGLFSLASVAIYVLNDMADRQRDRLHPVKRHRPIAAGDVSVPVAWVFLSLVCCALAAGLALSPPGRMWPLLAYLVLNLAYSFRLKHVAIADAFAVAAGFVLRAAQGFTVLDARPTAWLLLTVFALCLLLVLGKRRRELAEADGTHRPALNGYTVQLLDHMILISASLASAVYAIHLFAPAPQNGRTTVLILATVPCALFGLFRYLQILVVCQGGGDPVRALLHDRVLVSLGLLSAALVIMLPI
jgi:4-hydroxybenzoate polyprenyltransferase